MKLKQKHQVRYETLKARLESIGLMVKRLLAENERMAKYGAVIGIHRGTVDALLAEVDGLTRELDRDEYILSHRLVKLKHVYKDGFYVSTVNGGGNR